VSKTKPERQLRPPQQQDRQPGLETEMTPRPRYVRADYRPAGKLEGKTALITGGDSGIGRAVAVHFALEGADVAISYFDESDDAEKTKELVEATGRGCLTMPGDVGDERHCKTLVSRTVDQWGKLDIVVNNAAEQHPCKSLKDISRAQLERTFRTNLFSYFYVAREALQHLQRGGVIINTASVTAYRGSKELIDYSATKGAIVSFTRSLALSLAEDGIRVNGVAPGPIWTPLIPATFAPDKVATFGSQTPLGRAGEPDEVAPCFVFLASEDSSYITGHFLHPNGGEVINT
jgi:NAD(P)-dependent dehydrogenase (short-subunit alcohol dehydrogenase family)